jgi:hypothetical protein
MENAKLRFRKNWTGRCLMMTVSSVLALGSACNGPPRLLNTEAITAYDSEIGWPLVAVDGLGRTFFAEQFQGTLTLDALGTPDVETSAPSGPSTVVSRTGADGTRDWIVRLDDLGASAISTNGSVNDGSLVLAGNAATIKLGGSGQPLWTAPCDSSACTDPASTIAVRTVLATADGGAVVLWDDNTLQRLAADGKESWASTALAEATSACSPSSFLKIGEAPDRTLVVGGNTEPGSDPSACPYGLLIERVDPDGNIVGSRRVAPTTSDGNAWLLDLAVGTDGSVFATGDYSGSVDFSGGADRAVLSAGTAAFGFAMKMNPDFSLSALGGQPNQMFPEMIAPLADGGLVTVINHGNSKEGFIDPYIVGMDGRLRTVWQIHVGSADTSLSGLAQGGDVLSVVGTDGAMNYANADPGVTGLPYGQFLSRYGL